MRLTLKVHTFCNQPVSDLKTRTFESFPVIIGRSTSCHFVLQDVSKYISSNHAIVLLQDGVLLIQDTSANGTYLNGANEPIGRENTATLSHADKITMGDYTVSIEIGSSDGQQPQLADPFASMFDEGAPDTPEHREVYDPFKGTDHDWSPPSSQNANSDDWDIDVASGESTPRLHDSNASDKHSETSTEAGWADWIDKDTRSQDSPDSLLGQHSSPNEAPTRDASAWLPDRSSENVEMQAHSESAHRIKSTAKRIVKPERASVPTVAPRPEPSSLRYKSHQHGPTVARPDPPSADIEVFLAAAGIDARKLASSSDKAVLEQSGRLLHLAVEGMMSLLQSRAELKNAIRSDVTQLARIDNNPLKFSYSAGDALTKLLTIEEDGYLGTEEAITQAVDDLKLHQLALLEGMKLAVKAILLEFDPQALERKLESDHPITASIPLKREAELWELFQQQYETIRDEAVNNFGEMFGREFREAYKRRLRKAGREPDF